MEFVQVAPRRAEAADGTTVELLDRHHARLDRTEGTWLVEVGPAPDEEWFSVTVHADSLVRAGGDPDDRAREQALAQFVAGIRALRVRVDVSR